MWLYHSRAVQPLKKFRIIANNLWSIIILNFRTLNTRVKLILRKKILFVVKELSSFGKAFYKSTYRHLKHDKRGNEQIYTPITFFFCVLEISEKWICAGCFKNHYSRTPQQESVYCVLIVSLWYWNWKDILTVKMWLCPWNSLKYCWANMTKITSNL